MKKERDEMKRKLRSLKEAQEPLLRKIRSVESELQPIEQQMKEMVSTDHSLTNKTFIYLCFYTKVIPLFFQTTRIKDASQKCKQKHDQLELRNKEVCFSGHLTKPFDYFNPNKVFWIFADLKEMRKNYT